MISATKKRIFGIAFTAFLMSGLTTSHAAADNIALQCIELFYQNETPLPPGTDFTQTPPPGAAGKNRLGYTYHTLAADQPVQSVGWVTPHFTLEPQVRWLVPSYDSKIQTFNSELFNPKRPQAPYRGGQRGSSSTEQWTHYVFENMSRFLQELISKNNHGLDDFEVFFIHRVLQVLSVGTVDLRFVSPASGIFDQSDSIHRIAVTKGAPDRLNEPIYLNQDYFSLIAGIDVKRNSPTDYDSAAVLTKPNGEQVLKTPASDWTIVMPPEKMAQIKKTNLTELQSTYFSILIHELGHYLGIADSPDRPLDQIAARITQAVFARIERHNLGVFNQPLTEFQLVPFKKFKANRQLFLVDFTNSYDLTEQVVEYVENRLKTKVTEVDFSEISLEKDHSWDYQNWTFTRALMLTAVAQTPTGAKKVRLRIVIEPSVSEMMGFDINHPRITGQKQGLHVSGKENFDSGLISITQEPLMARIYIQERTEVQATNSPKIIAEKVMNSQTILQPGETWKFAVMVDIPAALNVSGVQAQMTSKDFVWSGPIKQERITANKTWIERIGATKALIHVELTVPQSVVPIELSLEHILLKYKEGAAVVSEKLRLQSKLSVQVQGKSSRAKLIFYGYPMFLVEPQTAGKLKMPLSISSPAGNVFQLVTLFENFKTVKRAQVVVTIYYKNQGDAAEVETVVLDPFQWGNQSIFKMPYHKEQTTFYNSKIPGMHPNRPLDLLAFAVGVPKTINGKTVDYIKFENLYILFSDYDQIFAPIHNVIFVEP